MPSLANHHGSSFVKLLYAGDSGTGKTGSLVSLVQAGYNLRILDMDNGLDSLVFWINQQCPDKIGQVDYETVRDKYRPSPAGPITTPKAFVAALGLMTKWSDSSDPATWGANTIFVLDTTTALGRAAFEWAKGMNPTAKDPRQWYATAQKALEDTIALLTSEAFQTNVIVITHIEKDEKFDEKGNVTSFKEYVSSIGKALGPKIPRYFNTLVLAESIGSGRSVKRKIKTVPTGTFDLKNPVPTKIEAELPLESGLATLFSQIKEK